MADSGDATVLDSWEELDDSRVLNKKLKEIKISNQDGRNEVGAIVSENQDRTQYQPQVRILKRDCKSDQGTPSKPKQDVSKSNANKHTKTLEQREKEYAEARLRILGSACGGFETEQNADNSKTSPRAGLQNSNNNAIEVLRQPRGPDGSKGFDQLR